MQKSAHHTAERLAREMHALTEVAKTLTLPLDLPDLLDAVLKKIVNVLDQADVGVVMLWDQPAGLFRPEAAFGFDLNILKSMGLRAGESITGKVYDDGEATLLSTSADVARAMSTMRPANRAVFARALAAPDLSTVTPFSVIAAPIAVDHQKLGVLVLETLNAQALFTERDLPFIQILADLIALSIDRAQLEDQANAMRDARQAERMRSEIMATLSHELRMPLSAIKGYTTAMLLEDVDWGADKQNEFLHLIDQECDNMQGMLKDILDSSLIEVEQLAIEHQPLRLPRLAHEVVVEMQMRSDLHRLLVEFPPNFPIVEADPRWTKQVFRNIIDNAIKYSPDGGLIVVRGEVRPSDVVVSVADQGIGISPEDLIPLFEKYFRVRSATSLHISGTGLGLPIARTIIEAHGGRIWAESKVGQGTTLYFSLPRSELMETPDE